MIAYCFADGVILFDEKTPKGALPIMAWRPELGMTKPEFRDFVTGFARRGYEKGVFLIPGVPEVDDEQAKMEALLVFDRMLLDVVKKRQEARA